MALTSNSQHESLPHAQHGGKRVGAGRKPKPNAMITRSICLPGDGWGLVDAQRGASSRGEYLRRLLMQTSSVPGIPTLGDIPAGPLQEALETCEEHLPIAPEFFRRATLFSLRVQGDSMSNAGILDGDWAVLQQQSSINHGEIAAVLLDHQTTLKRVLKERDGYLLKAENSAFASEYVSPADGRHFQIAGKLVGIVRRCH